MWRYNVKNDESDPYWQSEGEKSFSRRPRLMCRETGESITVDPPAGGIAFYRFQTVPSWKKRKELAQ